MTTSEQIIKESEYKEIKQSKWLNNRSYIIDVLSKGIENEIIDKLYTKSVLISEKFNVKVGLQAYEKGKGIPSQSADDVKNHVFDYTFKFDNDTYKYLNGGDIYRYGFNWSGQWLRYGKWLSQPKNIEQFSSNRILIREITAPFPKVLSCVYLDEEFLNNKSIINILDSDLNFSLKYLLSILNSSLIGFYHLRRSVKGNRELFPKIVINDIKNFPIKDITLSEQKPFIDKSELMLKINKELNDQTHKFQRSLERKFALTEIPRKIQDWYLLSFTEFIKELEKKKVKLTLSEEAEWETYFVTEAKKALILKEEIEKLNNEINKMVYRLYELTEKEIKIVEEG